MKNKTIVWLTGYSILVLAIFATVSGLVIHVDPFFHFHKPFTEEYFYALNNQRSQNNGIVKNFNYSGIITGTSMTENFKTSEAESLWGGKFIKIPFSGSSYKEINDNLNIALRKNPSLDIIIQGLDMNKFMDDKDLLRLDLGQYPWYLYDDILLNDIEYILNRDVFFQRVYSMIKEKYENDSVTGITSFDQYSNWMRGKKFGVNAILPEGIEKKEHGAPIHLTDELEATVRSNIEQNIVSLIKNYPDVDFYYFFTPYSVLWWKGEVEQGTIYRQIEAERIVIEELLKYPNIKLFSFNCVFNLTTNLNHYKDTIHYAEWINIFIMRCMFKELHRLTLENYDEYLGKELQFYLTYDYMKLIEQEDYDNDDYGALVLTLESSEITGNEIDLNDAHVEIRNSEIIENQYDGKNGILCSGSLQRKYSKDGAPVSDYLRDTDFIGCKIAVDDFTPYKFIVFYGKKIQDHGQPSVYVYNKEGNVVAQSVERYTEINDNWKQYVIDINNITGEGYIIFQGGYVDSSGDKESKYIFSDITIY